MLCTTPGAEHCLKNNAQFHVISGATLLLLSCSSPTRLWRPSCYSPARLWRLSCFLMLLSRHSPATLLVVSCYSPARLWLLSCYSPATLLLLSCCSPATLLLRSCSPPMPPPIEHNGHFRTWAVLAKSLSLAARDSIPALASTVKCTHVVCDACGHSVAQGDGLHGNVFTHTARQEICGVLSSAIVACCWFKCLC